LLHTAKKLSHRPKKPKKLGVDPFTWDPKDTQRFVHAVEIKLDYFSDSLVQEIDKVSLLISLLKDSPKNGTMLSIRILTKMPPNDEGSSLTPKMSCGPGKDFARFWNVAFVVTQIGIVL